MKSYQKKRPLVGRLIKFKIFFENVSLSLQAKVNGVDPSSAYTPEEVLGPVGNGLAVYLDDNLKSGDIDARG